MQNIRTPTALVELDPNATKDIGFNMSFSCKTNWPFPLFWPVLIKTQLAQHYLDTKKYFYGMKCHNREIKFPLQQYLISNSRAEYKC